MTAKRFKLSYPNGAFLIDGDKPLCSIENDLMIVDLLNELAEENKQLKTFLEALREELSLADRDNTALEKENEQLKKELFEARKDYILETYADNPVRRDEKLKSLEKEL